MQDRLCCACLLVAVAACTSSSPGSGDDDGDGVDAAAIDAPALDASAVDGSALDAATFDAATFDAATFDAAIADAATFDAATFDAAIFDAAIADAAIADAGQTDGAPVDAAGLADAAPPPDAAGPVVPLFTKHAANPVLEPSSTDPLDGAWDRAGVYDPTVVQLAGGSRAMFYVGYDDLGPHNALGRAVSPDGVSWTADPEPSLGLVSAVTALEDGGTFSLYYVDLFESDIRLATSPDGVSWTQSEHNPLIDLGGVYSPSAVRDGTGVTLWYVLVNFSNDPDPVVVATSPDGITFTTEETNLAVEPTHRFSVLGGEVPYQMWMARDDGIYYLTSPDGVTWTDQGVSLAAGPPGSWDEEIGDVSVVRDGDTLEMWYVGRAPLAGYPDKISRIGYATSP